MKIQRLSSGTPWESQVGYSRVVRAGDLVFVAGTTGTDADGNVVSSDVGEQAERAIENVRSALERVGARLEDVVRVTMYLTDLGGFDEVAPVHKRFFGDAPPAATAVQVEALAEPEMAVEFEVTAAVAEG